MPFTGLVKNNNNAQGIPPIYGPKTGITLVMQTIAAISTVYGIFKIKSPKKQRIPMIIESKILP